MKNSFNVLQLSDTHLFADEESEVFGVKTNRKFSEVLQHVFDSQTEYDFIFLTGDISQDETMRSYEYIVKALDPLNIPIYWIPGNHDDIPLMESVFKNAKNFHHTKNLSVNSWFFIFLNTKLDHSAEGFLSEYELDALKESLAIADNNQKIVVVMHHHSVVLGTPLLDQFILKNKEDFWKIIENTQVKLIICGHVHESYKIIHNNITLESAPATCFQFKKGAISLSLTKNSGYKSYQFYFNGYESFSVKLN